MLRRTISLTALAVCLALAGAASAHGGDRSERADRGERTERADRADRAERDRVRDAERAARDTGRDAQKAGERSGREAESGLGGTGSGGSSSADLSSAGGASDPEADIREGGSAGSGSGEPVDEDLAEQSGSSGSGSGGSLEDNSGSSGSGDADEDDGDPDEDNSGSDDDEDDEDEDDSEQDNEGSGKGSATLVSDDNGHVYRDREVLILLPQAGDVGRLSAAGFTVIEKRQMRRDGALLIRVGFAQDVTARDALTQVRRLYPEAAIDLSHVYTASAEAPGASKAALLPEKLDQRRSDVNIAVIDGFSSGELPDGVELKSFVKRAPDLPHGAQVMSVLLADLDRIGAGHPKRLLAASVAGNARDSGSQASVYDLADALDWAASEGADIINISLAGPPNEVLGAIVQGLGGDGILMFAAVGNTGPASHPGYPAAYGSVIGVTAVSSSGAPYLYAARGEEVELSAMGVGIRLTPDSDVLSGTSFAVPRVVALAAWLMNATPAGDQRENLRALARDLGAPGRDHVYGYGLVPTPAELKPD